MKKCILLLACASAFYVSMAQEDAVLPTGVQLTSENVEVPDIVRNKFSREHPNIKPTWQAVGKYYMAEYMDESDEMKILIAYDKDSNIMREDKEEEDKHYPKAIKDYISKHYPNENYTVWYSKDSSGNKFYYTKQKSTIVWFDKEGKFMLNKKNDDLTGE